MMAIGIIATIASTVIGAAGQMQAANATAAAAEYNAEVNRRNAIVAQNLAADARKRGIEAVNEQHMKTAALKGRQIAVISANNLDVTSGSPLDVLGDTAQIGEWDARTIRGNFEREALGHETQVMNFNAEAGLNEMKARSARSAGMIAAAGSIAGGLGTVADKWYNYNTIGKLT